MCLFVADEDSHGPAPKCDDRRSRVCPYLDTINR